MGVYGLAWTPAFIFGVVLDPGTKFFGPFSPKFKNLQFSHKTPQYGCLQTQLNPSIHIRGNLDPGAKF